MTTDTVGGVWTFATTLARGLCARGVRIDLATAGPAPSPAQRAEADSVDGLTLHGFPCDLEWMDDPWHSVERWTASLRVLAARTRPDLIHANAYAPAALPWEVPVILTAHSCVSTWWRAVHRQAPPPRYGRYERLVRDGLSRADAVVAPTVAFARALADAHGIIRDIAVVRNGCNTGGFARPREERAGVLAAGRLWDDAKNVRALLAAAAEIRGEVRLAGDAGDRADRPASGASLLGRLDPAQMRSEMKRAAVFAHPARYEPFGLAPLEAALAGCALVLGDIPTLRELWDGAAEFVDPDDHAALAAAINGLLNDPQRRARAAARATERAGRYSQSAMWDAYAGLYANLTGVRHASRTQHSKEAAAS